MSNNEKKYLLAIKRRNNDYLSLEWHLTKYYENENLLSLAGIDDFTKKITRSDLLLEALNQNIIDLDEKYLGFAIIYFENGKYHELKEGTIFKEDNILNEDEFISFIIDSLNNKELINKIYNLCVNKNKVNDEKYEQFTYILKHIFEFNAKGSKTLLAALNIFKDLKYENKRSILIKISRRLIVSNNILI